jgi:hypothetical protein
MKKEEQIRYEESQMEILFKHFGSLSQLEIIA